MAQIRDFVGRLSELQQEHQSLQIRILFFLTCGLHMDYILEAILNSLIDTGIAEQIMDYTITEEFNKILEVQQSKIQDKKRGFHAY